MTAKQLPARPSLEQLKRMAKDLLQSARDDDPAAIARFRTLPAFARHSDDALAHAPLALHDAQSVIAREHGFDSWNALRERVEELTLAFDAALVEFIEAATDDRSDRAERLLALHPSMVEANLYAALVVGGAPAVEPRLARDPSLATTKGGPRDWEPLHYVCYTSLARSSRDRQDGLAAIARRLIAAGADANARFPWEHHGVRRPVLWGAVCRARALPLATVLLDAGADPNDGVTLPLAASGGDVAALELLAAHGADVDQPWATDGSPALYAILAWSTTPAGALWLLEHGADPNATFAANGETPLHAAARTEHLSVVRALLERGADVSRRNAEGRTPYAVAIVSGNDAAAAALLERGASSALSVADRLTAAGSRGDDRAAREIVSAHPSVVQQLTDEHYAALHRAAERGDVRALETMLDAGFDPNRPDESIGKTALHSAAMAGQPASVRVLLAHGASVSARDREFHGPPLVWAAEGARSHARGGDHAGDHAAVGRLLLDAGSPVDWQPGAEPAQAILDIIAEWRRA